ncbi:MAG: methionyl-tRNA synthetase [bacterium]|jgi:methionyl-tRNA synthetase
MKKKLITSALPYVNNVPHLGNIIGCVLSADVYARFCRSQGYETAYICATDEYGTATETKAREEGLSPKEICDKYHVIHKAVYEHFRISFDYFGRTSTAEHTEITQSIFLDLEKAGMIEEQESSQSYCEHDDMFLADRFVEGVCPHCNTEGARGDQCDSCGKLLQPTELINPTCKVCGNTPIEKETKHLYINLPALEERLVKFQNESMEKGDWNKNAIGATKSWIDNGLQSRPITRDLKWGIPVPKKGYEDKVFYVWFDAPIGYISNTKRAFPDDWKRWWHDPEGTELYQFMAKDNIPFHTVVFPASLIGSGQSWTLLHHISSTEYLNYENEKFSKSRHIGVFGTDVIDTGIDADLWRFYLLYNRPEKSDANFVWDGFFEEVNSSFIDNIGNLLNRTMVFLQRNFEGTLKEVALDQAKKDFLEQTLQAEKEIVASLEKVQIKDGLKQILALGKAGNKFFQDQAPWASIKTSPDEALGTLTVLVYLLRDLGILIEPYMPATSSRILGMLNVDSVTYQNLGQWDSLKSHTIATPEILFKKLDIKQAKEFKEKYSGKKSEGEDAPKGTTLEDFQKLEIKVGEVKKVERHPDAERLYVEEVDCGEGRNRTIVSGLVKYISPEEFLGKKVLVATNLEPAKIRGIDSEGMVLAAEKRKKLEVVSAGDHPVGSIIQLDGVSDLNRKSTVNIDEFFAAPITVEDGFLWFQEKKLMIEDTPIQTEKVLKGNIR